VNISSNVGKPIEKVQRAFKESMDILFNKQILPIIFQIQSMSDRAMGQDMDALIQKTIESTNASILNMVDRSAKKAIEFADFTFIEEIKPKIKDSTAEQARELESKILNDITTILNKVDEAILNISCSLKAVEAKIREDLYKDLPTIINRWMTCGIKVNSMFHGNKNNYMYKSLSLFETYELYELKKCFMLLNIKETVPVLTAIKAYKELEFLAAGMRCYSFSIGSIDEQKYYIKEMEASSRVINSLDGYSLQTPPIKAMTMLRLVK